MTKVRGTEKGEKKTKQFIKDMEQVCAEYGLDYEDAKQIDPFNFHEEWLRQADLCEQYSTASIAANKEKELAHERLKTVRSRVILAIKRTDKASNQQQMEALYRTDPSYILAKEHLIQKEYEAELLHETKNNIHYTRKDALQELVRLHLAEYFSIPGLPKDIESWTGQPNRTSPAALRKKRHDRST